ncbi:MAG: PIG-L deacetylase family protein [Caldisericum exile]|uniref:PIG-L deacetylase family protein n=1 Tax=Caldisericum exile TaxID=693075 RepID=UPI003C772D38
MNNLIIAAHPDDEVLGCGGTIARLFDEGQKVFVAILGEGITSRYNDRKEVDINVLEKLKQSSEKAACLLGIDDLFFFNLPDNRFDTIPLLEIVKIIESVIYKIKPETIFTHHGGDLNIDHAITNRATLTAVRPITDNVVKTIYAYEVPSSTEWAFGQFNNTFKPNVFIDISKTLEKKIEAMLCYETEVKKFPHPRSPEALRTIAKRWGSVVGKDAVEAFELIRDVR